MDLGRDPCLILCPRSDDPNVTPEDKFNFNKVLAYGSWQLAAGSSQLVAGSWQLAAGFKPVVCLVYTVAHLQLLIVLQTLQSEIGNGLYCISYIYK